MEVWGSEIPMGAQSYHAPLLRSHAPMLPYSQTFLTIASGLRYSAGTISYLSREGALYPG